MPARLMTAFLCTVIIGGCGECCSASPAISASQESNRDKELLQGNWEIASFVANGKEGPPSELEENERKCSFTGDRIVIWHGEGTYKLGTAKPNTIDIAFDKGEGKGKTYVGVYSLEGDTLKICLAKPGRERPKEFKSDADSGLLLVTYRRVKSK